MSIFRHVHFCKVLSTKWCVKKEGKINVHTLHFQSVGRRTFAMYRRLGEALQRDRIAISSHLRLRGGLEQSFRAPLRLRGVLEQPFRAPLWLGAGSSGHFERPAVPVRPPHTPHPTPPTRPTPPHPTPHTPPASQPACLLHDLVAL